MTQESTLSYLQFTAMSAFTIFPLISTPLRPARRLLNFETVKVRCLLEGSAN